MGKGRSPDWAMIILIPQEPKGSRQLHTMSQATVMTQEQGCIFQFLIPEMKNIFRSIEVKREECRNQIRTTANEAIVRVREQESKGATTMQRLKTDGGVHNKGWEEAAGSTQKVSPPKAGRGQEENPTQGWSEEPRGSPEEQKQEDKQRLRVGTKGKNKANIAVPNNNKETLRMATSKLSKDKDIFIKK